MCRGVVLMGMTFSLAFADLNADAPRQRARCAATGRFVAWAKVPQLRAVGAARVVVIPPVVVPVTDAAPVVEIVSAPPVDAVAAVAAVAAVVTSVASTITDTVAAAVGWLKRSALRIARRAVVAAVIAAHPAVVPAVGVSETRLEAAADASGWGCPM